MHVIIKIVHPQNFSVLDSKLLPSKVGFSFKDRIGEIFTTTDTKYLLQKGLSVDQTMIVACIVG